MFLFRANISFQGSTPRILSMTQIHKIHSANLHLDCMNDIKVTIYKSFKVYSKNMKAPEEHNTMKVTMKNTNKIIITKLTKLYMYSSILTSDASKDRHFHEVACER